MATPRYRLGAGVIWPRAGRRTARTVVRELVYSRSPRCPVCGTRLLNGDPLGICGARPAHAECALIHWLAQGQRRPRPDGGDISVRDELQHELELLGFDEQQSRAD